MTGYCLPSAICAAYSALLILWFFPEPKTTSKSSAIVFLKIRGIKYFGFSNYDLKLARSAELCSKCCEHYGLIKKVIKDDKIENEPTDIKEKAMDFIVDILDELGVPHSQY